LKKLEELFHNNYAPLCNYAAAYLKDKHAAEDIVQAIFIQLWKNEKIFHLEEPTAYLIKCVRFKCIDFLRAKKKKREILMASLPEISQNENPSIEEEDVLSLLHFFAAQLPPKMQQVFLLSRQQGMSYKEIATHLDISAKTVENQMGAALKKLRILLKRYEYLSVLIYPFLFK
jgi:RNA polymerase sigma-70 factor (ECF subfamily)